MAMLSEIITLADITVFSENGANIFQILLSVNS